MIDVFIIRYDQCRNFTFVPRQARWFGGPSKASVEEIEREFPLIWPWIYRVLPDGSYQKWQFAGRYKY